VSSTLILLQVSLRFSFYITEQTHYRFSGASRYRAAPAAPTPGARYIDPFTGASRYVASSGSVPTGTSTAMDESDPFTGGSRYTGASEPAAATTQTVKIFPVVCLSSIVQRMFPSKS
jgi:phospholipase A-2-activating protein